MLNVEFKLEDRSGALVPDLNTLYCLDLKKDFIRAIEKRNNDVGILALSDSQIADTVLNDDLLDDLAEEIESGLKNLLSTVYTEILSTHHDLLVEMKEELEKSRSKALESLSGVQTSEQKESSYKGLISPTLQIIEDNLKELKKYV